MASVGHSDLERLSDILGKIYDASLAPEGWQSVVEDIVDAVSANSGQLFTPFDGPDRGGFHVSERIPDSFIQQYAAKYHAEDVWTRALGEKKLLTSGGVATDEDLVPRKALLESKYYKEFLRPANASRFCGSVIFGPDAEGLRVTFLCAYRGVGARPFTPHARRWMQLLNPHISRSLGITFRLQDAAFTIATTRSALDRIQSGVLLLDASGAVSFLNRAASALLQVSRVVHLRRRSDGRDHLFSSVPGFSAAIEQAVASTLRSSLNTVEHFSKALHVPQGVGNPPLVLNFSALPYENPFGAGMTPAAAIVFIADASRPLSIDESLLRTLFGLTSTEVEITRLVCEGRTVDAIAQRRRVASETVRTQLKSVFAKTDTKRQSDLLRLVFGLCSSK